jgi:hypothetical protein
MKGKDSQLIWEAYNLTEGPIYVDPSDERAGNLSDYISQDSGRGGDSDLGKAKKYGKVGKEDESGTIDRINRVALKIYQTLKDEQDARSASGEDVVSSEKWSNLKFRLLQIAKDEGIPATRAKFFMRVVVNALKVAGIIQVHAKTNKVEVDTDPEYKEDDIEAIEQGVERVAKKGLLGRLFGRS